MAQYRNEDNVAGTSQRPREREGMQERGTSQAGRRGVRTTGRGASLLVHRPRAVPSAHAPPVVPTQGHGGTAVRTRPGAKPEF